MTLDSARHMALIRDQRRTKVAAIRTPDDVNTDGCTNARLVTIQPRDQATSSINYQYSVLNDPGQLIYLFQEVFTEECGKSSQVLILSAYSADDSQCRHVEMRKH
jgi:hypothetical protein